MRIGRIALCVAGSIVAIGSAAAAPRDPLAQPIRIGVTGPDLDACLSTGRVTGLNARGDNFLNVRSGPSAQARVLVRLKPEATLTICDRSRDAKWLGVIYAELDVVGADEESLIDGGPGDDCGVSSPVPHPRIYAGPCKSGWVSAKFVEIIAG